MHAGSGMRVKHRSLDASLPPELVFFRSKCIHGTAVGQFCEDLSQMALLIPALHDPYACDLGASLLFRSPPKNSYIDKNKEHPTA